ncbi:MAG: LacI family DNA-binding transcriptional regulator, partial [Planctomycetota bacterium]
MPATMKEIAVMANVSQAAVSIAINNKKSTRVSESKRKEILRIAQKLGYSPSISARHLRGKKTRTIGIIGGVYGVPVQHDLVWRISSLLQEKGYQAIMVEEQPGKKEETEVVNDFIARGVDAIIFASRNEKITKPPIPHLEVDTGRKKTDIGIDKEYGGYEITRHLIEVHGHKDIAFLTFLPEGTKFRYNGHIKAIEDAGISYNPDLLIHTRNNDSAEKQVIDLVKNGKATAFCCSNDYLAAQLIATLQRAGIKVP